MVTQFEQALNLLDAAQNTIRMAMQYYETEGMIAGVLWGADHMLDEAIRSLQMVRKVLSMQLIVNMLQIFKIYMLPMA